MAWAHGKVVERSEDVGSMVWIKVLSKHKKWREEEELGIWESTL